MAMVDLDDAMIKKVKGLVFVALLGTYHFHNVMCDDCETEAQFDYV